VAHQRPTASDVNPPTLIALEGGRRQEGPPLTRAEARALRRSAPLTRHQLEQHFGEAIIVEPPLRAL
jgi:hypothetical protein